MFVSCPKCGKPDSATDESFCGSCEHQYMQDMEQQRQEELNEINQAMNTCPCQGDEPCQNCCRRMARLASLNGNEAAAIAWLNQ